MYAVGRLGSYITRGVSTVSGPFHPFGGAVDIIVVQQQDGSLKSSPWYVRFGKFQGVLKVKERVVDIYVNGVEAGFQMYLNPKGEAYFLKEGVGDSDSKTQDCEFGKCNSLIDVNNGQSFSRTLGFTLERKALNDLNLSNEDGNSSSGRKSAEIAAELLERKWSTSFSNRSKNEHVKYDDEVIGGKLESSLVLHEEHFVHKPKENETEDEVAKEVDKVTIANVDSDGNVEIYEKDGGSLGNDVLKEERLKVVEGSCTEEIRDDKSKGSTDDIKLQLKLNGLIQEGSLLTKEEPERVVEQRDHVLMDPNSGSDTSPSTFDRDTPKSEMEGLKGSIRKFPSDSDIVKSYKLMEEKNVPRTKSLPNLFSHVDDSSLYPLYSRHRFSKWDMLRKDAIRIMQESGQQPKSMNGKTFMSNEIILNLEVMDFW